MLSTEGPVLLCALIGLPAAAWNKEPLSPKGQTGTRMNVAPMLISVSHDYRLLWKLNATKCYLTVLQVRLFDSVRQEKKSNRLPTKSICSHGGG